MNQPVSPLERTFIDLVAIDEVHPHEEKILTYVKHRLKQAGIPYRQDAVNNIVGRIPGGTAEAVALVGHVDIAAPLGGRQVIIEDDVIKTDGTGLLGGDDKAAVAVMLELADAVTRGELKPGAPIELIFTVGEEAGCVGATSLDMSLVKAKSALVLDWTGRVNRIVTKSPAYIKIDVEYLGRTAHPAQWQEGKNAGSALIAAASKLKLGEYASGVTCNIGIFGFGKARNQVPGAASLQAELRSYDTAKIESTAIEIKQLFQAAADEHGVEAKLAFVKDSPAYELDQDGRLFADVSVALAAYNLEPALETTYGCFDANILASRGLDVVILGTGYYNPHSPGEYLIRSEFKEFFKFIIHFCQE